MSENILWFIIIIFSILTIIGIVIGMYVFIINIKLVLYLKSKRLTRYKELFNNVHNLSEKLSRDGSYSINIISRIKAQWHWFFSGMDEEDEIIKKYKNRIRASIKFFMILFILLTLLWIIGWNLSI